MQRIRVDSVPGNPHKWNGSPIDSAVRYLLETCAGNSVDADTNRQGWSDLWL